MQVVPYRVEHEGRKFAQFSQKNRDAVKELDLQESQNYS